MVEFLAQRRDDDGTDEGERWWAWEWLRGGAR